MIARNKKLINLSYNTLSVLILIILISAFIKNDLGILKVNRLNLLSIPWLILLILKIIYLRKKRKDRMSEYKERLKIKFSTLKSKL